MTNTRVYRIWAGMINRCHNDRHHSHKKYGAKGITVCDRWRNSFAAFLEDMGLPPFPKATIDRFPNNKGNYEPGNCRWATMLQQNRNTCHTRLLAHDGKTLCITEWAELKGLTDTAIHGRLNRGWSVAKALDTPLQTKFQRGQKKPEDHLFS
jgi:hypothetical protein